MGKLLLLSISLLIISLSYAQTNESDASLYIWKKNKTESQDGYVVLKSGEKLEGKISLKGSNIEVEGILYIGEGKEIEFPMTALSAYGLNTPNPTSISSNSIKASAPICDHNEGLFLWRSMGEQMGKTIENTKPRNGYVIKNGGIRVEGELQLKKEDGVITTFKLKSSEGKFKFEPEEITNYGLQMTINEITNNGEKTFNIDAKNFQVGSVHLKDGRTFEGWVAFADRNYINNDRPGLGDKYNGLYYSKSKDEVIKTYNDIEIEYVTQNINGEDLKYSPYEGGFVAENALDNATFRNKLRKFNSGTLTLVGGNQLIGNIAQIDEKSLNFKSNEGILKLYGVSEVEKFEVVVDGENKTVINMEGELTEELFNGNTFWLYNNPNPTTVNESKTNFAKTAVSVSTGAASAAILKSDDKKNDSYDASEVKFDSIIQNSTLEELKKYRAEILMANGVKTSEELENTSNQTAKNYVSAFDLAIAGREVGNEVVVYYDEMILINKETNEMLVLYKKKKDANEKLDGLLKGCYTFLSLDKSEQKKYYNLDDIQATVKMLDECY